MITLITYSSGNMERSAQLCIQSALKNGVDQCVKYSPNMIGKFIDERPDIFKHERGAGYWAWKPYIIADMMNTMTDGEILIYSDSGLEFIDSVNHIISRMKDDFFFFSNGWLHKHWCKSAAWPPYWDDYTDVPNITQIQASLLFFRVSKKSRDFVKAWLSVCTTPGVIDDSPCEGNHPEFQEHRHDQAVLTTLAYCWDINYENLWPDKIWSNQRHRWPHSDYPPIVLHHRKRDPGKGGGQPEW